MKLKDAVKVAQFYVKPDRAKQFANHMVPHVVRPAQIIWNKALGALFAMMALLGFHYSYLHRDNPAALIMAAFFGTVMAFFAVTSFLRARSLSRL